MVRGDVGDLSQAQAIVVLTHMPVLLIAPPGSSIDSIDKLKGHTVGVLTRTPTSPSILVPLPFTMARHKASSMNTATTSRLR